MGHSPEYAFCGVGHCAVSVKHYGPQSGTSPLIQIVFPGALATYPCICRIWLCTVGHSAEFSYALWAIAQNLVMYNGSQYKAIDHNAASQELILKVAVF